MASESQLPKYFTLSNGQKIPALGFGTYSTDPAEAAEAVKTALKVGYRHIDCARMYPTEAAIGAGIASSGVPRSELFITTKVWNNSHHPSRSAASLDASLKALQTSYVDLLLVHWPVAFAPSDEFYPTDKDGKILLDKDWDILDTWRGFEKLLESGKTKTIGVSNFTMGQLEYILENCKYPPVVNQVEMNPWLQQNELLAYCDKKGIHVTAYTPLAFLNKTFWKLETTTKVHEVAARLKKDPASLLLSWAIQRGTSVIPKSFNPERIKSNFEEVFFLPDDVMADINSLERGYEARMQRPLEWEYNFDEKEPPKS